jgi:Asp-tRNA(Asn)/Glu-tRNA(Gln) amidotransferase A subunit family amidase
MSESDHSRREGERDVDAIVYQPAHALAAAIRDGEVSATEVLEAHLAQIDRHNPPLNAIITLDEEGARRLAREADDAIAGGESLGPLHGVPMTLKDGHETMDMRTVVGLEACVDHVPAEDGAVAARLKRAGAIVIGKTNVPPRLRGLQADNPVFGRTNNPFDLERTPGGSSGGAAAALAAGLIPLDIGSDLGGSIRLPAHFCGVYGFKPTERTVALTGQLADPPGMTRNFRIMFSVGPMARHVDDLELALRVIAGPDGRDHEVPPVALSEAAAPQEKALRIAFAPSFPGTPVAVDISDAIERFATAMAGSVARVEPALPPIDFAAGRQLFSDLTDTLSAAIYPVREDRTPATLSAFLQALDQRDVFISAWERFFDEWDVLLCPPVMCTAFTHRPSGEPIAVDGRPEKYWSLLDYCCPFNLTGHPAGVLPIGFDSQGLPIGVQAVGKRWSDLRLLAIMRLLAARTAGFRPPPGFEPAEQGGR